MPPCDGWTIIDETAHDERKLYGSLTHLETPIHEESDTEVQSSAESSEA